MTSVSWFLAAGLVLLFMAIVAGALKRLSLSTSIVYLGVGIVLGPTVLGEFHFNPLDHSAGFELVTEIAVLISVFAAGLKLSAPVGHRVWFAPFRLATISMALTVGLVALASVVLLDLPIGAGVLLGAILAPTDPVLAHDVQVTGPGDRDQLRFALTAEAGLNDGAAFPMVMLGLGLLGLHDVGENFRHWLTIDLAWACVSGLAVGAVLGASTAWLVHRLAGYRIQSEFTEDFLGLGLIALSNAAALLVAGYGFLAVFAAGYMLRRVELRLGPLIEPPSSPHSNIQARSVQHADTYMSQVSLMFVEQLGRLAEVALLVLVGGMLFASSWQWDYVLMALVIFFVIRPLSVLVGLAGSRFGSLPTAATAWFGVRGIGTLYYLMYSVEHGLEESTAAALLSASLVVITLSVALHGVSVAPLMQLYNRYSQHS